MIARTVEARVNPDCRNLGRMYRSRQQKHVRFVTSLTKLSLLGMNVEFVCCNRRYVKAGGKCIYFHRTDPKQNPKRDGDRLCNEIHIVLKEENGNFAHITMHPDENITGVRTELPLEETGFLRTELKHEYPPGVLV